MSWIQVRICDSCDQPIEPGDLERVSYPLAMHVSIDLHAKCAEKEPKRGFTTAMAKKARNRNNT